MKPATNLVARMVVELLRRADLLDDAVVHHHDPVGQRHRLDLVVRHVDGGGADLLVHLLDLGAHLHAQLGVEVRQRLVEQEDLRIAHDRAAHGHTLPLAARQLLRLAIEQVDDVEDVRRLVHAALDLGPSERLAASGRTPCCRTRSCADRARSSGTPSRCRGPRRDVVDDASADQHLAVGDLLQARDHAQGRGLAAARRPDQHEELVVGDLEIDAAHCERLS